jgi:hypothetical protein
VVTSVVVHRMQLTTRRTLRAAGADLKRPHRHGSIAAVLANPFAGSHATETQIAEWMTDLRSLADEMATELRDALTTDGEEIEAYGKGAIVGVSGELEIAAAWHVPAGAGLRAALGDPKAQVPSSKKVGALGSQIDIPLVHLHASYLRSHYDVEPVVVPDGPRPDDVVYALVMSTGARPAHRIGGFTIDDVHGDDGLR